jgi:hypothetical protein
MKTTFKSKMAFLFILIGLSFSCKNNDTVPANSTYADSTQTIVDTVAPIDTTTVIKDTAVVKDTLGTKKK